VKLKKVLFTVAGIAAVAIVSIGLFNFNLMLEIWVKVLIGVLFAGAITAGGREILKGK
jgi:hypothetical protein